MEKNFGGDLIGGKMPSVVWKYRRDDVFFNPVTKNRPGTLLYKGMLKRIFDAFISSLVLIITLPCLLLIATAIAVDGGRPIFGHKRVGRNGRIFSCYKFRTMAVDAEARLQDVLRSDPAAAMEWLEHQKLKSDPRITALGHFLRKTSLDELPQIWNVIVGDMSLVGPRPVTPDELGRYGTSAYDYMSVRPGITGLWQVSGRNGTSYAERVRLDRIYTSDLSLGLDLRILARTVPAVLRLTGI